MGNSVSKRKNTASEGLQRKALVVRTLIVTVFVVFWEGVVRFGIVDDTQLAAPSQVFLAAFDLLGQRDAQEAFAQTGSTILTAFVVGTGSGLVVAAVLGASDLLRKAYMSPILFILSTPKSIFLPVFALIFGISNTSAAAFGAFEAFFYVVVNVVGGLGLVDARHLRVADAFDANLWWRYIDVIIPSALPGIFAALWFGIKHAFLGVMISQLWASQGGVGALIRKYSSALQTDYAFAVVLLITLVAIIAGATWTKLESHLTKWREGSSSTIGRSVPA